MISRGLTFAVIASIVLHVTKTSAQPASAATSSDPLYQLSMEELLELKVTSATLTPTEQRQVPAAVTLLDQTHIRASGARSLDELLDIYVPGFQYMKKLQANMIGIRGIISDRSNKMLLLVNGRNMNIKARDGGALSERDLTMLGDIRTISVVRGPGSAVHGPGAIAGVISLETYTGLNFQGLEGKIRGGVGEDFLSLDLRYGVKLTDTIGLFAYYGIDDYSGADQDDAPLIFSTSFTAADGSMAIAGEPVPFPVSNSNRSFDERTRHKVHLQLTGEQFDLWLRYTKGGILGEQRRRVYTAQDPGDLLNAGSGYEQFTLFADYDYTLNERVELNAMFSFDIADVWSKSGIPGSAGTSWREDEYLARVTAAITPSENQHAALGMEFSHEIFGKDSRQANGPSTLAGGPLIPPGTEWDTNMVSVFGEHQWRIDEHWTTIVGLRVDKHTYTPTMWSPRAAVIYTPSDPHTLKLIYNRSVRRSDDVELYRAELQSGAKDQTETIDNLELRYEYLHSESVFAVISGYYNLHDVVSFNGGNQRTQDIGESKTYGFEIELAYRTAATDISFSHNYTHLVEFELSDPPAVAQNISAEPYGFGNELANWSDHITKLAGTRQLGEQWSVSASLRVYWGYHGGQDLADYHADVLGGNNGFLPLYDKGVDRTFDSSVFLNLGVEWQPTQKLRLGLHGYNLLGEFDEDLNKRNHFQRTTQYRAEAASLVLSISAEY